MDIPHARESSDSTNASKAGDTSVALAKVVTDAITTSIGTKTATATFSVSGKQAMDVMATIQDLRRKGYRVSQSGTDFTITW